MSDLKTIEELEQYFKDKKLPATMKVAPGVTFTDVPKFVKETLELLDNNDVMPLIKNTRLSNLLQLKAALERAEGN